jgi:hypothetical protein
MNFGFVFDQLDGLAELRVQRAGRIAHHRQAAALQRPVSSAGQICCGPLDAETRAIDVTTRH